MTICMGIGPMRCWPVTSDVLCLWVMLTAHQNYCIWFKIDGTIILGGCGAYGPSSFTELSPEAYTSSRHGRHNLMYDAVSDMHTILLW